MKISTKIFRSLAFGCAMSLLANSNIAQSQVIVIPMSGDDLKPLKNIVTVAKENGDFTDPVEAMESITDADEDNPYLLVIAPGNYTLTSPLVMKYHVDIAGSGRNATQLIAENITGGTFAERAMVVSAFHAELTNLSLISNDGNASIGIYNNSHSPTFSNLYIEIKSGGTGRIYGIYNLNYARATTRDTSIRVEATGSAYARGVASIQTSFITLDGVKIVATSTRSNGAYGAYSSNDSTVDIFNSRITANEPVRASNQADLISHISSSFLLAGNAGIAVLGTAKCSFVFGRNNAEYDSDCDPIVPSP